MLAGLVLAALPIVLGERLWLLVVGGWLGLAITVAIDAVHLLRARPALAVQVPKAIGVGDDLALAVQVQQRGRRALAAIFRTEVTAPLEPGPDVRVALPPGSSAHTIAIHVPRRGTGRVVAVWLRVEAALGLVARLIRLPIDAEPIRVLPNTGYVRELALACFGTWRRQGSVRLNMVGQGTELDSLDAYQPGMDLHSVDWKTTARHQALRVRRFQAERNQRVMLCFDTGRLMADPIDGLQRLDHAIHAGLLLAYGALKGNDLVGMHAYSGEPEAWVPPRAGMAQLRRVVGAAAGLEPRDTETNHVLGMHDLLRRLDRRSLVVVFTELTDPTTTELMVEYVGHLAQHHLVVFFALDDPALEMSTTAPPATLHAMAEATVAGSMRHDRQRVLRRLRQRAIDVIHGPPRQSAIDLLQRYVRLKQRRLLG